MRVKKKNKETGEIEIIEKINSNNKVEFKFNDPVFYRFIFKNKYREMTVREMNCILTNTEIKLVKKVNGQGGVIKLNRN